nr:RNA polymerase sigma factor [Rhodopirellula sp. JC740]
MEEDAKSIFVDWLEKHQASIVQVARAYTLSSDESQDLAQEILLQAWRSLPRFRGQASPSTWFYRVALYTAMNWKRDDQRRRTCQQPLLEVQTIASASADSIQQAEHRETLEQLYKAIHQLPQSDVALVLLYLDEMSYREMASVLGISESNVGVRLNRAKNALSRLLNVEASEAQQHES